MLLYREALQEDDEGALQPTVDEMVHRAKRRKLLERPVNIRLGMVCSEAVLISLWLKKHGQALFTIYYVNFRQCIYCKTFAVVNKCMKLFVLNLIAATFC